VSGGVACEGVLGWFSGAIPAAVDSDLLLELQLPAEQLLVLVEGLTVDLHDAYIPHIVEASSHHQQLHQQNHQQPSGQPQQREKEGEKQKQQQEQQQQQGQPQQNHQRSQQVQQQGGGRTQQQGQEQQQQGVSYGEGVVFVVGRLHLTTALVTRVLSCPVGVLPSPVLSQVYCLGVMGRLGVVGQLLELLRPVRETLARDEVRGRGGERWGVKRWEREGRNWVMDLNWC
jgi:hypothetical protein